MINRQWKWNEHYRQSNETNCKGKRTFNSSAEAHSFNKRAPRFLKGSRKREHLHIYKCNLCKQWHLGHTPSKPGKYKEDRND